jgi:hypothetical protein
MYISKFLIDENCFFCLFKRQLNYKSVADPKISKWDGALQKGEGDPQNNKKFTYFGSKNLEFY